MAYGNSKKSRYDDREKVSPGRFRELPAAARQCRAERCHWPSSISAETATFRRERVSSPLPERRDSSEGKIGPMPGAGISYANESGTAEAQLSSLQGKRRRLFLLPDTMFLKKERGKRTQEEQHYEAHQDF